MKILVTGGAGFIGSHVVDRFVDDGHDVSVVDSLVSGDADQVHPEATLYEVDIRDPKVEEVFEEVRPQVVVHHAAQMDVRRSVTDPIYDAEVNILGTLRLLEYGRTRGLERFVHISTGGAVYGEPREMPVSEDHPIDPLSPYGVTKHTAEHYLFIYRQLYGLPYVVLRYANVYGPRQSVHGEAGVVAIFSERILKGERCTIFGDGSKTRDYVFVGDIVEANVAALSKGDGGIFNLGRGVQTSDFEVFDEVRKALGVPDVECLYDEKRPGEIEHICLTPARAKEGLGWEPTVDFAEGIGRTVGFYREHLRRAGVPIAIEAND